jgi:plastocyanin domain-containing protein
MELLWLTKRHHGSAESNAATQGAAETSTDSRLGMEPRISVYSRAVKWRFQMARRSPAPSAGDHQTA